MRSDDGRLEIQVRQQPELAIASNAVAFDTAVAMLVDGRRVEVDPGISGRILVDGRPVQLHGLTIDHLNAGGELYYDPVGDVVVKWPDGSKAVVYAAGPGGYVVFSAAPDLVGTLKGLLTAVAEPEGTRGLATGDEVLIGGNGRHYVLDPSTTSGFRTLYREFAPTWQITPKESLFTYLRGKSTSSYILKDFPGSGYYLGSVPPNELADLRSVCRKAGITDSSLLDDCVFDAAATRNPDSVVAAVAARTETIVNAAEQEPVATAPTPVTGSVPKTIPLGTGNGLPVTAADPKTDTTYVAWATNTASAIDLCVVVAAGSCNGTGKPDQLVDPTAGSGTSLQYSAPRIVIMPDSGQVVVVADVEGVASSRYSKVDPPGYTGGEGDVAWASPAGGAGFAQPGEGLHADGMFRAAGVPPEAGAVALSPTVIAVFENDTYQRSFADFTLTSPAPATPADPSPSGGFGQGSGSDSGQLAAEPVSTPAGDDLVVGIALGTGEAGTKCAQSLYTVGWGSATGKSAPDELHGSAERLNHLADQGLPAALVCGKLPDPGRRPEWDRRARPGVLRTRRGEQHRSCLPPFRCRQELLRRSGPRFRRDGGLLRRRHARQPLAGLDWRDLRGMVGRAGPRRELELRWRGAVVPTGGDRSRSQQHRDGLCRTGTRSRQIRCRLQQLRHQYDLTRVLNDAQLRHPHEGAGIGPTALCPDAAVEFDRS